MSRLVVYFEKQGADNLCGAHCLNHIMQGPVFTGAMLSRVARELDDAEKVLMAKNQLEAVAATRKKHLTLSDLTNANSENADWSGNFSVGVLERALKSIDQSFCIENANRPQFQSQFRDLGLVGIDAIVINFRSHWYCYRRVCDTHWYLLDSLKAAPIESSENEVLSAVQAIGKAGGTALVVGSPKPLESANPAKCKIRLESNQWFLTAEDVKKMHNSERVVGVPTGAGSGSKGAGAAVNVNVFSGQGRSMRDEAPVSGPGNGSVSANSAPAAPGGGSPKESKSPKSVFVTGSLALTVRLPDGSRHSKNFDSAEKLGKLFEWIMSLGSSLGSSTSLSASWVAEDGSRKKITISGNASQSIGHAGIENRSMLMIST